MCAEPAQRSQPGRADIVTPSAPPNNHGTSEGTSGVFAAAVSGRRIGG